MVPGQRASAHIIVSSLLSSPGALAELEGFLYGTDTTEPKFPTPSEIIGIYENNALFVVIDHGDGTWTARGPDDWFEMVDPTQFKITTPSAEYIDPETYKVRSW
jgi:hypothetical protein